MASNTVMVDSSIFEDIQQKIDDDTAFNDELRETVQQLNKQVRSAQAALSQVHAIPRDQLAAHITKTQPLIHAEITTISQLATKASQQPYYKWNHVWTRSVQDACFTILFAHYAASSALLTIEDLGARLSIPVNLKDRDAFHLTIEEYLLALISLIEELARLARNAVTIGDYSRPLEIARFVNNIHAGFQILNLKNDILRRRSDGIKYRLKEVEDVVYDLSLRGLVPKEETKDEEMKT
ncbi:Translin [Microthyrium microscopicum]|uniref:Translin n=1 Tax=Microthyrium microscopicum TaxID=703497 RepID=A0A6A6TWB8_9PEZI|nr:Translin [Microthyrium microscopicum]